VEANDETTEERSHGRCSKYVAVENIKISIDAPIAPNRKVLQYFEPKKRQ
jgi:hypothetical protein